MRSVVLFAVLLVGCSMDKEPSYNEELEVLDRTIARYEKDLEDLGDRIYDQAGQVKMVEAAKQSEHTEPGHWEEVQANLKRQREYLSSLEQKYRLLQAEYQLERDKQAVRIEAAKEREGR